MIHWCWAQGFCALVRLDNVPAGTFSSKLLDETGITFVCELCAAGTMQPSGASVECLPCKAGEYQDLNGSISCKRCGMGEYQDQTGALCLNSCAADSKLVAPKSHYFKLDLPGRESMDEHGAYLDVFCSQVTGKGCALRPNMTQLIMPSTWNDHLALPSSDSMEAHLPVKACGQK